MEKNRQLGQHKQVYTLNELEEGLSIWEDVLADGKRKIKSAQGVIDYATKMVNLCKSEKEKLIKKNKTKTQKNVRQNPNNRA